MIYIALSLALIPFIHFTATPDGKIKLAACFYNYDAYFRE